MKRQQTIWIILTTVLALALAACAPAAANPDAEPSFLPAAGEATAVPAPADAAEATAVPPEDLPAIPRESTDSLAPATAVPEAVIAEPEGEIMTPPPPDSPAAPAEKPGEDQFVQIAKEDLAQRLAITPQEIALINYEEMQWRDGSLGCPQPKMQYIQVITPGYRIQLEADGQLYNYHGAAGREPFLCTLKIGGKEIPLPPAPSDQ